jgi:hypothetical protein
MKQSAGALFRTALVLIANRVVHSGTSVRIAWALPINLFCLGNPETPHIAVVVANSRVVITGFTFMNLSQGHRTRLPEALHKGHVRFARFSLFRISKSCLIQEALCYPM